MENGGIEQTFTPKIIYPRNHAIQTPFVELKLSRGSDMTSFRIGNQIVQVRSIPLPADGLMTKNNVSLIETIHLPPTSTELQPISQNEIKGTTSVATTKNTIGTVPSSHVDEISAKKMRKKPSKRKKLPDIHVNIRDHQN